MSDKKLLPKKAAENAVILKVYMIEVAILGVLLPKAVKRPTKAPVKDIDPNTVRLT